MTEVLLARSNQLRREHAALETLVLLDRGELRVRKRVPGWAAREGRIDALLAARERIASSGAPVRLPEVLARGEDWLDVAWVAGEPALARVERLLLARRHDDAAAALAAVTALLDGFPVADADPAVDPGFRAVFGAETGGREPCVSPGLYDFGLDNLVLPGDGGPAVLVDWEWAFAFPVPVAFVRWVGVRHTAEYLQPLLRALASPSLPMLVPFDDLLVPERWLRDAGLDPADTALHLARECAFQDWLHVVHRPFADHEVHPHPARVTARADENAVALAHRLQVERDEARARLWQAERRLADLAGVKHSARHLAGLLARRLHR